MEYDITPDTDTWTGIPLSFPDAFFANPKAWARTMADALGSDRRDRKAIRETAIALTRVDPRPGLLARLWHRAGPGRPLVAMISAFPVEVLPAVVDLDVVARSAGPDAMTGVSVHRFESAGRPGVRTTGSLLDDDGRTQYGVRIAVQVPGVWLLIEAYAHDPAALSDDVVRDLTDLAEQVRFSG